MLLNNSTSSDLTDTSAVVVGFTTERIAATDFAASRSYSTLGVTQLAGIHQIVFEYLPIIG